MAEAKMYGRSAKNIRDGFVHMLTNPEELITVPFNLGQDAIDAALHYYAGMPYSPVSEQRNMQRVDSVVKLWNANSLDQREAILTCAGSVLLFSRMNKAIFSNNKNVIVRNFENIENARRHNIAHKTLKEALNQEINPELLPSFSKYTHEELIIENVLNSGDILGGGILGKRYIPEKSVIGSLAKTGAIVENPLNLTPTHAPLYGKNKLKQFVEKIKTEGIQETIKIIEHDGVKYVVDGHHRLYAARALKLIEIPIENVELPYKGYKTVMDLNYTP